MSNKIKQNHNDLIEDITVEELRSDGLVEDVEVSSEEPKKKADDAKPASTVDAPGVDTVKAAIDAAPVAMAPHSQGTPEAPTVGPEVQAALDSVKAAIAAAPVAEAPKTKAGLISAMYQHLSSMKTEDLANVYQTLTTPTEVPKADEPKPDADSEKTPDADAKAPVDGEEEAPVKGDEDEKDAETDKKVDEADESEEPKKNDDESEEEKSDDEDDSEEDKESDDEEENEDDEKEDKPKKKYEESLDVLMKAENSLSEDFRSKASELFESTVNAKVKAEVLRLEETYQTQLDEEVVKATTGLSEKVDSYLSYVASTWMEENKVAIEAGLRTEIAENFMKSLQGLFKESFIEVPEGKENLVDSLNKEVAKLEEQLLKTTESNMKLNENVNALTRKQIIKEAASDLASTEAVKLNSLVESVDFEDAASFAKKVVNIKESFLRKTVTQSQENQVETAIDENGYEVELTPIMENYSSALSRLIKQSQS